MISFKMSKYGIREFGYFSIILGILFSTISASIYFYKIKATSELSTLNVEILYEDNDFFNNYSSSLEIYETNDSKIDEDSNFVIKKNTSQNTSELKESLTNSEVSLETIEVENIEVDSEFQNNKEINKKENIDKQKDDFEKYNNELVIGPEKIKSSDFLNDYQKVFGLNDFDQSLLGSNANYITIPIINLNSKVEELELVELDNSMQYNTPKNVVGHIPDTSKPGEIGNSWYFGHLQSPLRDEGDVFRNLPLIPDKMRDGFPVYVVLNTDVAEFAYKVISTKVMHQDELDLYSSEYSTITLVTCVPKLIYDHRLVVTARLVGVRKSIQSKYKDLN
ncbi:MAG: sortase [SAR202 cluster bacterium]|nr:sortase [SAR202 cluster bacterium]